MAYCMYLRKSRTDLEAEARGEGETLARHEKALLDLARKQKLNIKEIYREIVSGETIASRPVMQKLLAEVEQGLWNGVLVMEIERLARGDTIDQGIVAQAFKLSDTLIITPTKTYDPNDEFDEEYFEFGLFMSRREYKTINRRLQRGRLSSVMEGKYVGNVAPYGYKRVKIKNDKGFTLEPLKGEAETVELIFDLYVNGKKTEKGQARLGTTRIANELNALGIKPRKAEAWVSATIRDILANPTYIGKVRWGRRASKKKSVNGKIVKERPIADSYTIVDGLHKAIIDEVLFYAAQDITQGNKIAPVSKNEIMNPFAGLLKCKKCGRTMIRRPNKEYPDLLICSAVHCNNVGSKLEYVEDGVLEVLEGWIKDYETTVKTDKQDNSLKYSVLDNQLDEAIENIKVLKTQMNTAYEMLEQGVYSTDVFIERSGIISNSLKKEEKRKEKLLKEQNKDNTTSYKPILPQVKNVLDIYSKLPDAGAKNEILKKVISEITYEKEKSASHAGVDPRDFSITVYPALPRHK